jgi:hypothetical protein
MLWSSGQQDMLKTLCRLALLGASIPTAAAAAQDEPKSVAATIAKPLRETVADPSARDCKSNDPSAVVVCGPSQKQYRIDPDVLIAERATDAPPIRAPLTADDAHTACIGPECGTGGVIPVIGMILVAATAVAMAADGDDCRNAVRTHEDEDQAYLEAKARRDHDRRMKILPGIIRN